jgi:hypothetical protein
MGKTAVTESSSKKKNFKITREIDFHSSGIWLWMLKALQKLGLSLKSEYMLCCFVCFRNSPLGLKDFQFAS